MDERQRPMGSPARIRAAVAYSGRNQDVVARAIGISKSTLARWGAGSTEGRQPDDRDLAKLAVACDVPLAFLEYGFESLSDEQVTESRFRSIEAKVDRLVEVLGSVPLDPDDAAAFVRILRENQMRAARDVGKRDLQSRRVVGQSGGSA